MGHVLIIEDRISKVTGNSIGIYMPKKYQEKLGKFLGKRVKLLVMIEENEGGREHEG